MRNIMIVASLLLGLSAPALADEKCPPLQELLSIQMEWDGGRLLVPVTVEGTPVKLMLDTGGVISQLSEATVKRLGLRERDSQISLISLGGQKSDKKVIVKEAIVGNAKMTDVDFQVMPGDMGPIDGIFNASTNYDIDLDFGAGKINFFSPDHCEHKVVYWKPQAVAMVPIRMRQNHIQLDAMVNGKHLDAIIDTGATNTFMPLDIARLAFGLTPDSPGMTRVGQANNDPNLPIYAHVFDSIAFEGVAVNHPRVGIMPDLTYKGGDNRIRTGSLIERYSDEDKAPPLGIGMNVLRRLHIYLAFKEHMAYITPASNAVTVEESDTAEEVPDAPAPK